MRGLSHLIEKWGGRFGDNCRFSMRKIEFGLPFYMKISELRARLFSSHRKMRGRFDKKCRFSKTKIEFGWPFHMKFSALRARPFSSHRKMRGTIWRKVPIFKDENWVWLAILYEKFPRCARGLYHFIEKWGDDLSKIADFQNWSSNPKRYV